MLNAAPGWVEVPEVDATHQHFPEYPVLSIKAGHRKHGLREE